MAHDVHWYSPAPLWAERLQNGSRNYLLEPALLRFTTDGFMDELGSVLSHGAKNLGELLAGAETYREGHEEVPRSKTIPLYQPAHQRYYLVTASLVCRERGLPDRGVDTANDERTSFVLRRLEVDAAGATVMSGRTYAEYGWFGDEWRRIPGDARRVVNDEERLPMFSQSYDPDTPLEGLKVTRRLWVGLIPVARRETYEAAAVQDQDDRPAVPDDDGSGPNDGVALGDPRKTKFYTRVFQALQNLKEDTSKSTSTVTSEDLQAPFVFALLDLFEFLETHSEDVSAWSGLPGWIRNEGWRKRVPSGGIHELLVGAEFPVRLVPQKETTSRVPAHWAEALSVVAAYSNELNSGEVGAGDVVPLDDAVEDYSLTSAVPEAVGNVGPEELRSQVFSSLRPDNLPDELPRDLQPPLVESGTGGLYAVRCVYERPRCRPFREPVVSGPSRRFQLASFFDADAPPRPLRITLPGANIQDFRKSPKGVSLLFTKELRRQAQRVQDISLEALDDGDIGSAPGVGIGMICSLSIPIITICALILLLIIVSVLNIVFWWLPFFKICFPLPSRSD